MAHIHFGCYVLFNPLLFLDITITSHTNPYNLASSGLFLVSRPVDLHLKKVSKQGHVQLIRTIP